MRREVANITPAVVQPERMHSNQSGLFAIRPLVDPRWNRLVQRHPRASVFHTSAWLSALHRTFEYEPVAFTTAPPDAPLLNAVVFCRVDSYLTGRRLVSLPFSDHCDVLAENEGAEHSLLAGLDQILASEKLRYLEIRPKHSLPSVALPPCTAYSYCFHEIDLTRDIDTLFRGFHKSSARRKVLRAEREGLTYQDGSTKQLLDSFIELMLLTRRRHQIFPHPRSWFETLIDCFGDALQLRVASKDGRPVAAILTLRHNDTLVYKYGCSDARFHRLGGMHFLFWESIREAKRDGFRAFDLGRSEWSQPGLVTFKDRLGATRSALEYSRLSSLVSPVTHKPPGADWKERMAKRVCSKLPDRILSAAGDVIYRHLG